MAHDEEKDNTEDKGRELTRPGKNGGRLLNTKPGMPTLNPNGRGKGNLNSKTVIRRFLQAMTEMDDPADAQKKLQLSNLEVAVLKQVDRAVNGDTVAFNTLLDRMEGKAAQVITGKNGAPISPIEKHTVIFQDYTGQEISRLEHTLAPLPPKDQADEDQDPDDEEPQ